MHLENKSPTTSCWTRCAGLGAAPRNLTAPPPFDLDEDECDRAPDGFDPAMLATLRLEPPPQPAIRTTTPTSATSAVTARGPPRSRWRPLTVSAGRMLERSFAATFLIVNAPQAEFCDRDPSNQRSPLRF
jgi:hypothetical protein